MIRSFNVLILVTVILFMAGCASTRMRPENAVVGTWSYTVYSTPEGDVDGEIVFVVKDGALAGTIGAEIFSESVPFESVTLDNGQIKFVANFEADGAPLRSESTVSLDGDKMEGNMNVPGVGTFRLTGMRKG